MSTEVAARFKSSVSGTRWLVWTGVLAVLIVVLWMAFLRPDKDAYTDAIRAVIAQDKSVAHGISKNASVWEVLTGWRPERVDAIVVAMKRIDLSRCPQSFRTAYQEHIRAWEGYAVAYRAGGQTSFAGESLASTWHAVHAVAQQYGVQDAVQ